MQPTTALVQPFAVFRPYARAGAAIALVLVMLLSSGGALGYATGSTAASTPTGGAPMPAASGVQSGTQLQHDAFLQNPGTPLSSLPNASVLSNVDSNQSISFTVGFQMRNAEALASIISEQQTPGSGMYHQWLSLAQEESMFGPSPTAVQDTENYFTSLGFHVGTRGPISLSFYGTSQQVNQAFKTQLVNVNYGSGSTAFVNARPLALPLPIASQISSIDGLDSAIRAHPTNMVNPDGFSAAAGAMPSADRASFLSAAYNATESGNVTAAYNFTNHAFLWFRYYSHHYRQWRTYQVVTPAALDQVYQAMPLINQGINGDSTGTPITIAIIMAGGINPGDLRGFSQLVWNNPLQIINRVSPIPVDRQFGLNGTITWTDGGSNEMALDIEWSSTMAPGAKIVPIYGPTLAGNILDDDYAAAAAMNPAPNIVSNSWGGEEDLWPNLYGPNWANALTMHDYIMLLTGRGSTVLASSADGGGFDVNTGVLSGSFPATDPYVLSVDGVRTDLYGGPTGQQFPYANSFGQFQQSIYALPNETVHVENTTGILSQSFWYVPNTNLSLYAPPQASGGFGTSYWFTQPWYQHGLTVPNVGRALGSAVAAEADFNQSIFFNGAFEYLYGGTSFACPTVAGEIALIDDSMRHNGQSAYLGDGNVPVFDVANAYYNGNLTLVPFYDVKNGTSYWGNIGAQNGYSWPSGQVFPTAADGSSTYGNTRTGFDFPTGFGTINVYNFAQDLLKLDQMPGTVGVVNASTNKFAPNEWSNLQLNNTYTIDVNTTAPIAATNPTIGVEFFGTDGVNSSFYVTNASLVPSPSLSLRFTLNTSRQPFGPLFSPGLLIFTLGNATVHSLGFGYDWVGPQIPTGPLNVTVIAPSTSGEVGGYAEFSAFLGFGPPTLDPACCGALFPNTFTVRVTQGGQPVYDAQVLATVASTRNLAFENTLAEAQVDSYGNPHYLSPTIVSESLTNVNGQALVYTWNVIAPTTFFVNATYGASTGGTTYQIEPGPNVGISDASGGRMSNFNVIRWILYATHQNDSNAAIAREEANALNQTGLWNLMYGWQGERLNVNVNNYTGGPISGANVWLGTFDAGRETKFERYQSTGGTLGVTNSSGTANTTAVNGSTWIQIPDNMSDEGFFSTTAGGQTAGWGLLAVDVPGSVNRTFQYTEPCIPNNPASTSVSLITCEFNNSFQRNYTATPIIVLPNPVNLTVQTPSQLPLDFFGVGANVSFEVNVSLPTLDPVAGNNIGWNFPASQEHIVSVKAYVDGHPALDLSPNTPPFWQQYTKFGNLSNNYSAGAHNLTVVVTDSQGHVFTQTQKFIVGGVSITNLNQNNLYTVVPFVVNWTLDIPSEQVFNYTYNQSFDLRYVSNGCGGLRNPCPTVVNLSEKVHDGQVNYNQSINLTLMGLNGFYSGYGSSGGYPPGQYQIIIWLTANHSGSIAKQVNTYLIFSAVTASISGPGPNATVPLGNVTIAYNYSGGYINNASLNVYQSTAMSTAVFTAGAYQPAIGEQQRGGSTTWQAVQVGQYEIVLTLGTPYANYTAHRWINVTNPNGLVYLNQSKGPSPLVSLNAAQLGSILAIIGLVIGLFLGLIAAPAFRPASRGTGTARPSGPKPWDEGKPEGATGASSAAGSAPGDGAAGALSCPICHEPATNAFSLQQHQQVVHGIEE